MLEWRRETGLNQPVEAAELDLAPAERTRRLIAGLQDDEELGGVARVARCLMAAVHLPRSLSDQEELPVGGVTDISNRGPLDRLLLSELAHDSLTLAVRIALREALYLRREAPPRNPPRHRAVLLDAGLRMWGVPRVFATGVALALAATASRQILVDVFRAAGRRAVPVELATRAGLLQHLAALEPDVQPGEALAAFLSAASQEDAPKEAIVVTGQDVADDPAFQRALAAMEVPSLYLATVNREGLFRLVLRVRTAAGRFARRDSSWTASLSRVPGVPLHCWTVSERQICRRFCRSSPFRCCCPTESMRRAWPVENQGLLSVTRDGACCTGGVPIEGRASCRTGFPRRALSTGTRTRTEAGARTRFSAARPGTIWSPRILPAETYAPWRCRLSPEVWLASAGTAARCSRSMADPTAA